MEKKSLAYSAFLLFGLIMVSIFLNRGAVQSQNGGAHMLMTSDASQYLLGQTVVFTGTLTLPAGEATYSISRVRLVNQVGPQALDVDLPVQPTGGFVDISSLTSTTEDTLLVNVVFTGITTISGGTLPSTLPGSTLPGTGLAAFGEFTGTAADSNIAYEIHWTPGVLLDPVPNLTLIPETDSYFTIPTLTPPNEAAGTKLPETELAFVVPTAGETTGTALPETATSSVITIPQITLSTNAPSAIPDLPDSTPGLSYTAAGDTTAYMGTGATSTYGFAIPTPSYATSSAADFPEATDAFAIPSPTVATSSATSFASGMSLGNGDRVFKVPDLAGATSSDTTVKGMTVDTDGDYWLIIQTSGNDALIEVNGTSFAVTATSTMPSTDFDGIVSIGTKIYLLENKHRCWDDIETDSCDYQHRIYKIDSSSSLPTGGDDADWAKDTTNPVTAIYHFDNTWESFAGLTAGGSGDIWGVDENGCTFYNIYATG
ncbi:MAG: hypothetical protein QF717_11215, partial [SAR202 cluster bacterium]|nr:hypothetical protein [SAR202 cluster bacterium]